MSLNPTQVTPEEIKKYYDELSNSPKALADLKVIERCGGDLERSARILARRAGVEEVKSGSNWNFGLQKAREIVCDDNFKDGLAPGVVGGIIGAITATGSPVSAAVATPLAIYITQVGLDKFCESSEPPENEQKIKTNI